MAKFDDIKNRILARVRNIDFSKLKDKDAVRAAMRRNLRLIFYLFLLAMVILAMVSLKHCGDRLQQGQTSPHASGGDTLDVAIEYSPSSYYTYADTLGGFNYDLLRYFSARYGRPMKFHPIVTLSKALNALDSGYYDLVIAQFPVTRENKEHYLFTEPLYLDNQVLVQRKRKNGQPAVTSQLDLARDTVVIVKGSPMGERIRSLSHEIGDTIYVKEEPLYGPEQLFIMVATGRIRLAVINESIARGMLAQYPDVDISTAISFSQFQSITLKRGNNGLCDTLNRWIQDVKPSPFYKELNDRYF